MILFPNAPHLSRCDTLSPRGEGKVTFFSLYALDTENTNIPLAPWGEDAAGQVRGYYLYLI